VGRVRGLDLCHGVAAVLVRRPDARPGHAARPHAEPRRRAFTAFWRWAGAARRKHWSIYETASLLLAGLATPLVLSVHTVVSFDFTIAIVPGWHSTFFPPYFVAGAIYSGFAMVLALAIPLRSVYGLQGLITDKHLDNCGKVMLATG
jgi:Ni/Fe-hydrogenase subunit HybB-like protein